MRLLVVEDELDLQEAIAEGLRVDGYAVDVCGDGAEAFELLSVENYDLVLLDLNLPSMDGLEVLKAIRSEKPDLKILILSARSSVEDKVKGLDLGANDYLAKPFDFAELEARIRNLLKRKFEQIDNLICLHHLEMDLVRRELLFASRPVNLTRKEFALIEYFFLNPDRIISTEELMEHVWDGSTDSFSSSTRVHISSLRKKLKLLIHYDPIETRIGEGYRLTGGLPNV